jgi:sec-independent protein translocase protein TatC
VEKQEKKTMTIFGHLAEIRNRLLWSVIVVIFTTLIAFIFSDQLFHILIAPLKGIPLIFVDMTEMLGAYTKVCLFAGIALAMPFLIYQFVSFLAPGLTPREKKYVYISIPFIFCMFVGGVVFCYYIMLPPAVNFLTSIGTGIALPQIRISSYINLVTRLLLVAGIVFELPVISTFLARLGIVNSKWLANKRKWAIIAAFIIGAVVTPTPDPINQSLVALPLIVLYEISIWLAKLVQKRPAKEEIVLSTPTF